MIARSKSMLPVYFKSTFVAQVDETDFTYSFPDTQDLTVLFKMWSLF